MKCKSRILETVRPNLYNKRDLMSFAFRAALPRLASNTLQISPVRILYERLLNKDTVIVNLFDQYKRFLILKHGYDKFWTLPGGVLKRNGNPKSGAVKEVQEETGLKINQAVLNYLGAVPQNKYGAQMHIFSYVMDFSGLEKLFIRTAEIEEAALVCVQDLNLYTIAPYAQTAISMVKFTN